MTGIVQTLEENTHIQEPHCSESLTMLIPLTVFLLTTPCHLLSEELTRTGTCVSPDDPNLMFNMTSGRNASGHWIGEFTLEHSREIFSNITSYNVEISHKSVMCTDFDPLEVQEPPPSANLTGKGYVYKPGIGYYKLHVDRRKWHAAKEECESEGTHLAIVNSAYEARALLEIFAFSLNYHKILQVTDAAFVGVHDLEEDGKFVTIFGQPLSLTGYTMWAKNEPNNYGMKEDCVTFKRNGRLNDVSCDMMMAFFCEKELEDDQQNQ